MNIQMIDEFRRRTNASYDEARYYLDKNNGDLLEAIIAFERDHKGHHHYAHQGYHRPYGAGANGGNVGGSGRFLKGLARMLQKLFDIKLVITDKNFKTFRIPIIIPIALLPVLHIMVLMAIIMMFMGYKFGFQEAPDANINVEAIIDKIRNKAHESGHGC